MHAASVFGEQWKLEPMSAERKKRWRKEVDWLLSVTDYIVEFVPSQQKSKDGTNMEVSLSLSHSHACYLFFFCGHTMYVRVCSVIYNL